MAQERLFFFGTLMDEEVLSLVIGRTLSPSQTSRGVIRGHRIEREEKDGFPILSPCPGREAEVMIVDDLDEADIARLMFYEGDEYKLESYSLYRDGEALTALGFSLSDHLSSSGEPWDFARWQAEEKDFFLILAELYMDMYGLVTVNEADELWPLLLAKAERRYNAELPRVLLATGTESGHHLWA